MKFSLITLLTSYVSIQHGALQKCRQLLNHQNIHMARMLVLKTISSTKLSSSTAEVALSSNFYVSTATASRILPSIPRTRHHNISLHVISKRRTTICNDMLRNWTFILQKFDLHFTTTQTSLTDNAYGLTFSVFETITRTYWAYTTIRTRC